MIVLVITSVHLSFATTFPNVSSDVLLYYQLDKNASAGENETFIYDFSRNGRNSTVLGGAYSSDVGYTNGAYRFASGTSNGVLMGNLNQNIIGFNSSKNYTFSFWFKPTSLDTGISGGIKNPILYISSYNGSGNSESVVIGYNSNNLSVFNSNGVYIDSNSTLAINRWYYGTITYETNALIKIYLNGTLVGNGSLSLPSGGNENQIGHEDIVEGNLFNGFIDEVIIYNKTSTGIEVLDSYNNYTDGLTTCGDLWEENKIYSLINNVSSEKTCFNITANNITLDCNGYYINKIGYTVSDNYGIFSSNSYNNITVKNCKSNWTNNGAFIKLDSSNSSIINITSVGIAYGIQLGGTNSTLYNSTIENAETGIEISGENMIQGVIIRNSINYGLRSSVGIGEIAIIKDTNISNSGTTDIRMDSGSLSVVNTTYVSENIFDDYFYRKWYFNIEVNSSEGYLSNANLTVFNISNNFINSQLTGTKGNITRLELTEYTSGGTKQLNTPHTINISKTGFVTNSTTFNLTNLTNIFMYVYLTPTLSVNIIEPKNQVYSYNQSLELNYSIANYTALSTCWYYILNSSNGYEKINTTINCNNLTFNVSQSDTYALYIYVNESSGINASDSVTFEVSMTAPAIVLNYPTNNKFFNSGRNLYFNYTAIDSDGLGECSLYGNWSGNFIKNYTWYSPTNNTMNFTVLNLSETTSIWNIWCNDTNNNGRFALNNYTFTIDTTYPLVNIRSISTTVGTPVFTFSPNITEIHPNNCFFSIFNSSGSISGVYSNISLACTNTLTTAATFGYGDFNLFIYANDSAGNLNYTNKTFTTEVSTGPGGGGGTKETIVEVPSNATFCGDGICQKNGNDLNVSEDFYSCAQDCPGFNVDSTFFYCFDDDPNTLCIWSGVTAQYVGLTVGLMFAILLITTTKDKSGKQVSLARFYLRRIKR